jgi:nicotinamidase-related amidase
MYEEVRDFYLSRGFGGRVGFGERPALVVIDMAKSWLDTSSLLGSTNVQGVMTAILDVLKDARAARIPIFFTTMAFEAADMASPYAKKLLFVQKGALTAGTDLVELDPRLEQRADEPLIVKQRASAFWGTNFDAHLVARKIDTLIITGCSTSGCIRGTAESAHNLNLHTIVVREAVGDRSSLAHEANLTDIDMRYGDVVGKDEVAGYLGKLKR